MRTHSEQICEWQEAEVHRSSSQEISDVQFGSANFLGDFRNFAESDYYLLHVCLSVRLFAWNNSAPTGLVSIKIDIWLFLGAFEKFLKKTIYLVMSVYMAFRMEQLGSHWTNVDAIWVFFENLSRNSSFVKIWQE